MRATQRAFWFILLAAFSVLILPGFVLSHPHIIEASTKSEVRPADLVDDLRQAQVVFVGELHDHKGHHQAQLTLIRKLADGNRPLAIGLEMFRRDSQSDLDGWSNKELSLSEFLPVYSENWGMWAQYRDIFLYARQESLKMIGLNISRSLTSKVAQNGFESLSDEDRQVLGDVQCQVSSEYSEFIQQALGEHGGIGTQFLYFCEAQLLWDSMMARHLVDFLKENEDYRVLVLAGSGHAWKFGIPRQMLREADVSYRVVLPEIPGRVDRRNVTGDIADYLWLDTDDDGWTF